jgi:hypothetical protein
MKTNSPEASVNSAHERSGFQAKLARFHQNVTARTSKQESNPPGELPGDLKNGDLKASERLTCKSRYQLSYQRSYSAQPDMVRGRETRSKNTWKGTKNVAEIHGNQEQVDALSRDYGLLGTRIQDAHRLTKFIQN